MTPLKLLDGAAVQHELDAQLAVGNRVAVLAFSEKPRVKPSPVGVGVAVAPPNVNGVVAKDGAEAVFAVVQLSTSITAPDDPVRFPGLDESRRYTVVAAPPGDRVSFGRHEPSVPPWWQQGGVTLSGTALRHVGLQMPQLLPEQLVLLHLRAVD